MCSCEPTGVWLFPFPLLTKVPTKLTNLLHRHILTDNSSINTLLSINLLFLFLGSKVGYAVGKLVHGRTMSDKLVGWGHAMLTLTLYHLHMLNKVMYQVTHSYI